jgi:hypothetical protein
VSSNAQFDEEESGVNGNGDTEADEGDGVNPGYITSAIEPKEESESCYDEAEGTKKVNLCESRIESV